MAEPTIQQLFDLTGKVALVTGGARNLGRDMACALAEAGASVAITGRSLEAAQKAASEIAAETSRRICGFACDVRYEDQVIALVDAVLADGYRTADIAQPDCRLVGCKEMGRLVREKLG